MIIFDELEDPKSGLKDGDAQPLPRRIGDFDRKRERPISLRLGDVEFSHESAFVTPNLRDAGHDFDGMMSPVALGITRVEVDLRQRTMAFTREP